MPTITRRHMLALGCSAAASPLMTPVNFASAPGENRLVVIILRGAMDGLDAVRPIGDPGLAALRGGMGKTADLDGFFGLHPALRPLLPLWAKGQLSAVHAVSTPYRDRRSHFDGQDLLEAGMGMDALGQTRDGWLNRLLSLMPGAEAETAYAIGRADMLLTRGASPVANWAPDAALTLSPQAEMLLERVLHDDPLFRSAALEAISLSQAGLPEGEEITESDMMNAMAQSSRSAQRGAAPSEIARFAASRLRGDTRIAAFSLAGFDTHARQDRSLPRALERLTEAILTLEEGLGPVWEKTAIVAVTEFGRTARLNGSGGTDHGTAGAMILAGGALHGGRVIADWPGLGETDLYQRRDLRPTRDLRAHLAWMLRPMFGVSAAELTRTVFPGLDMGNDPKIIL